MILTKNQKITAVIIFIIALGLGVYYIKKSLKNPPNSTGQNTSTATASNGVTLKTEGSGNYKIEQVPVNEGRGLPQPIPDLNRPITFSSSVVLSQEAKDLATQKIKDLQAKLKSDASYIPAWIDLGMYQKMIGDYQGTILSWQYTLKLNPDNYVPLGNLGDLYAYYIKDKDKAVSYYNQAISKGPKMSYLYIQLADVYRLIFNDTTKAREVIDQGLSKIPNDPSLLQYKESLK